jgi:hypothetical protein
MITPRRTAGLSRARNQVHPICIELLEERTFLSAAVESEDGSAAPSAHSAAAAQAAKQEDDDNEGAEREYAAAEPQQQTESSGKGASNDSNETKVEHTPVAPTPQGAADATPVADELLTHIAAPPQAAAWRKGPPINDLTDLPGTDVTPSEHVVVAAANTFTSVRAAAVAATKLVVSVPRVTLGAFSTGPLIGLAKAGADAVQQIPVVAQAMAMLPIDVANPNSKTTLPQQKRTYRFARLGNPISLLADAMGAFTEESARGPARAKFALARPKAWAITIAVLIVDCLALVCYRARHRHRAAHPSGQ